MFVEQKACKCDDEEGRAVLGMAGYNEGPEAFEEGLGVPE